MHPSAPTGLQLSVQARSEVIKRSTKALRQLGEKSRKRGGEGGGGPEQEGAAAMTFDEALAHLQQSQAHLETLSQDFVLSLGDGQQVQPACLPPPKGEVLLMCFQVLLITQSAPDPERSLFPEQMTGI